MIEELQRFNPTSEADTVSCCARFYEQAWVHELMGDSFHPGGIELSRRLFEQLRLAPGARVLDVACGTGTTAIDLCRRYDVEIVAVDFSALNIERARERAGGACSAFEALDCRQSLFRDPGQGAF